MLLFALAGVPVVAGRAPVILPMDGKIVTESYHGMGKINKVDVKAGQINLTHGPTDSRPGLEGDDDWLWCNGQ